MSSSSPLPVLLVGAGPVGCVLATMLARRGHAVEIFEKRPDMRHKALAAGRSINLVLTHRGLKALGRIGVREEILGTTVPVMGRMMHDLEGRRTYQAYGRNPEECNYSVSRGELNARLLDVAERHGVQIHFGQTLESLDLEGGQLAFTSAEGRREVAFDVVFGTDGAPSAVRRALVAKGLVEEEVQMMGVGYKELVFPASEGLEGALERDALHIWPRGPHFMMALANFDGSFTGTLYLSDQGSPSLADVDEAHRATAYFEQYYPDAPGLLEQDWAQELAAHPVGHLGTVHCAPWQVQERVLLLGDASHGIVPFFGQGLNSGFEDCVVLDDLLEQAAPGAPLGSVFQAFFEARKPHADAIAQMALENFVEMSERVGDAQFLLHKQIEARLEQAFPHLYRSRYVTVMYTDTPYGVAKAVGEAQASLLGELAKGLADPEQLCLERAQRLIAERLGPVYEAWNYRLT